MKEEKKFYSLVEYCGPLVRFYKSEKEYEDLLKVIDRNNNNDNCHYYFGNAKCEQISKHLYRVTVHAYNRLTPKMTISQIDNITSKGNEKELIEYIYTHKEILVNREVKLETKREYYPDIQIMYFREAVKSRTAKKEEDAPKPLDRRIKYIPVLYKRDLSFLDKDYVKSCLRCATRDKDIRFFKELANEFCVYHVVAPEIEKLRYYIDLVERGEDYFEYLYLASERLYESFIKERNSDKRLYRDEITGEVGYSRRRLRDFSFFVRDYMLPDYKRLSPVKYNQKLTDKQYLTLLNASNEYEQDKIKEITGIKEKEMVLRKAEQLKLF